MPLASIKVSGLGALTVASRTVSKKVGKEWVGEVRKAEGPIISDTASAFRGLGGARANTAAKSAGGGATAKGAYVKIGRSNDVTTVAKEFGAKRKETRKVLIANLFGRGPWEGVKKIDYSAKSEFGPWTGNQNASTKHLRGEGLPAGKAFHPAVVKHMDKVIDNLETLADGYVDFLNRSST